MTRVEPAPGQRWALADEDGWSYFTVESVTDDTVTAARGDVSRTWPIDQFGNDRFTYCGHDGPGLLPPYTDKPWVTLGCLHACDPTVLPLTAGLDVFGWVSVTRDGEPVWQSNGETRKRLAHMELRARETPGDWRLEIESALSARLYQRQPGGWVLVAIGMGFA